MSELETQTTSQIVRPIKAWVFQPDIFQANFLGAYELVQLLDTENFKSLYLLVKTTPFRYEVPFTVYMQPHIWTRERKVIIGTEDLCAFLEPYWSSSNTGITKVTAKFSGVVVYQCGKLRYIKNPDRVSDGYTLVEWYTHGEIRGAIVADSGTVPLPIININVTNQGHLYIAKLQQPIDISKPLLPYTEQFFNHNIPNVVAKGFVFHDNKLRRARVVDININISSNNVITSADHEPVTLQDGTYVVWHPIPKRKQD